MRHFDVIERGAFERLAGRVSAVSEMARMGAHASLAPDQRPLGWAASKVVTMDEAGNELSREVVPDEPGLVLSVVHFVELDDGRRVTTEAFGEMVLSVPRDSGPDGLREDLREFILEDELREVDVELAYEPRWENMRTVLREHGVVADDTALAALPFVVELDDDVLAALDR